MNRASSGITLSSMSRADDRRAVARQRSDTHPAPQSDGGGGRERAKWLRTNPRFSSRAAPREEQDGPIPPHLGRFLPRLHRLARRVCQPCAGQDGGAGADLALRPEGRRARTRTLRQDGAEGRDDLVLAAAGAALQLRCLRPVLGGGAGNEHADQPPRDHRHGDREPVELGRALYAHDRARLRGREIVQRLDLLGRARPLPSSADRLGREQYRLDPLLPAAYGPSRGPLARRGWVYAAAETERIFPAADVADLHR